MIAADPDRMDPPSTAPAAPARRRGRLIAAVAVVLAAGAIGFMATAIGQSQGTGDGGAPAEGPLIVPTRQSMQAGAQPAQPAPAAPAAPQPAVSATAPEVDDGALRYFLQQGDTRRAQAELQRLHRLYPNWEPPANLFDPNAPMPSDVQPIWDLYGAGDYAAARKAIADRQEAEPGWTPPDDLVTALDQVAERQRLLNAASGGQWETVLSIADGAPSMLTCDNIEVLWQVAEAFARTGSEQRAVDAETYIMEHCPGAPPKVAALQKALAFLPLERVEQLMARAADPPSSDPAFDVVRLEIARRQVSAANDDPKLTAPPEALALLGSSAQADGGAADALLLGFYAYRHDDAQGATGWFLYALQRGGGAKAAEGYVLSMNALGRQIESEPVAYEWRNAGRENMAAYISAITAALTTGDASLIQQPLLDRFSQTVTEQRSPLGAQALGWYAFNADQPEVAADWFAASLDWHPSEVAAFGLGLAYRAMDDVAGFQDVVRTWMADFPRLPDLYLQQADEPASARGSATPGGDRRIPLDAASAEALRRDLGLPASRSRAGRQQTAGAEPQVLVPSASSGRTSGAPSTGTGGSALGLAGGQGGSGPRRAQGVGCGGAKAGTVEAGWCLLENNRPFEAAMAFSQAGGGDAAFGAALAYLRMGLTRDAAIAAARAPLAPSVRRQIETSLVTQVAIDAYERGQFTQALEMLDQRSTLAPEQNDLMMMRGWSYYGSGDFVSAKRMFEAVDAAAPTHETRRALNTVNLRMAPRLFRDQ